MRAWSLPMVCSQKCGSGVVASVRSQKKVNLLTKRVVLRDGSIPLSLHKQDVKLKHKHGSRPDTQLALLTDPATVLKSHPRAARTLRQMELRRRPSPAELLQQARRTNRRSQYRMHSVPQCLQVSSRSPVTRVREVPWK